MSRLPPREETWTAVLYTHPRFVEDALRCIVFHYLRTLTPTDGMQKGRFGRIRDFRGWMCHVWWLGQCLPPCGDGGCPEISGSISDLCRHFSGHGENQPHRVDRRGSNGESYGSRHSSHASFECHLICRFGSFIPNAFCCGGYRIGLPTRSRSESGVPFQ